MTNSNSKIRYSQANINQSSTEATDCRPVDNHWEMLSMQEIYAMVSLTDVALSSPVVVNINLDFFTVERPESLSIGRPIEERIEAYLNILFCAYSPLDELLIDSWFHRLMKLWRAANIDEVMTVTDIPMTLVCQSTVSGEISDCRWGDRGVEGYGEYYGDR